jgi:superkiller protein 3
MALNVALESRIMDPEELCHAYSQQGVIACDQKAVMVAPWMASGWNGLAEDVRAAAV